MGDVEVVDVRWVWWGELEASTLITVLASMWYNCTPVWNSRPQLLFSCPNINAKIKIDSTRILLSGRITTQPTCCKYMIISFGDLGGVAASLPDLDSSPAPALKTPVRNEK